MFSNCNPVPAELKTCVRVGGVDANFRANIRAYASSTILLYINGDYNVLMASSAPTSPCLKPLPRLLSSVVTHADPERKLPRAIPVISDVPSISFLPFCSFTHQNV